MITNERQYHAKKASARIFEEALEHTDQAADWDLRLREAMISGIASDLAHIRAELQEYEDFRAGKIREMTIDRLGDLPDVLIRARISSGWTQRELAEELGIKEQQIQRYEATRYKSASFTRLVQVAIALDVGINLHATLPDPVEFRARYGGGEQQLAEFARARTAARPDAASPPPDEHVA